MAKKKSNKKKPTKKKGGTGGPGYMGYTGKTSKLSVSAYWVKMFTAQAKEMLTDKQVCAAMFAEFRSAKRYVNADVVIFRNRYNNGNLADQPDAPKTKAAEYLECPHCRKGVRKPMWGEKGSVDRAHPLKDRAKKKKKKKAPRKTKASVNSGKSEKTKDTKNKVTKKKE